MSPVITHAEHLAAELEARAALRDIWGHGYIKDSGPHRYPAAAGNLADSLADNPSRPHRRRTRRAPSPPRRRSPSPPRPPRPDAPPCAPSTSSAQPAAANTTVPPP